MKQNKLPFNIHLERKYNDINIERFLFDYHDRRNERTNRVISVEDKLHIELGKFRSFNLSISEIIDLGMRYALGKNEFRKMAAEIINLKKTKQND